MTIDAELLTVRQVARACGRSEETVRRWIWSGKLSARKLGNQLFVRAGDVRSSLDARSQRRTGRTRQVAGGKRDPQQLPDWLERSHRLQQQLFKKYGYFDVAAAVRESHDEH